LFTTNPVPVHVASAHAWVGLVIPGLWLSGVICLALARFRRWRAIRLLVRASVPANAAAPIEIRSSPGVLEPGVVGWMRPVLLLPNGIAQRLTPAEMNAILAHELCHVRRRDNLLACLHMIVETIFWFHPMVWWIGARLLDERERACDEEVVNQGNPPGIYAEAILKVCKLYVESPLVCVSGVTGADLKRRIESIMRNRRVAGLSLGKSLALGIVGILAFMVPIAIGVLNAVWAQPAGKVLQDQNITGAWQGSLRIGSRELRVVFKISLEDDKLKTVVYSIDQGGKAIRASAITRDGSTIKVTLAAIGGSYEGKVASDGRTIAGSWTQKTPVPLTLVRATADTAWAIPEPPLTPTPMDANSKPVFEVATIKPSHFSEGVSVGVNPSGLFSSRGTSLRELIKFAYDLHSRQIVGGPSWCDSERYDVVAKPDQPGQPSGTQLKSMIQKLLADRFQFTFHRDKRELSVYAITVAKSGANLAKNESDPNGLPSFRAGLGSLSLGNGTIAELAGILQTGILDRPVVDQTGLGSTKYDLMLKWAPDGPQPRPGANVAPLDDNGGAPPDLFAAFQQQLGLKLVSTKALVNVLVIDSIEKPSEN
jgi:uncharacterized protein (TIGR03435 family)